jgi:hypothetical protein
LVTFTTALSEPLILCLFFFLILQILIFHFHTHFLLCKKAVKHRGTEKYFVTMGAAVSRWREFRDKFLSSSCHIITAKVSLFRRGFFTVNMRHLTQNIKTLIQRLSFRFVPLTFTPLGTWLKRGSFQIHEKMKDQRQLSVPPGLVWDKRNSCDHTHSTAGSSCVKKRNYENEHTKLGYIFLIRAIQSRCE